MTMRAMEAAAVHNPEIENRVKIFRIRKPEEFYNITNDPDCIKDLINNPSFNKQIRAMRKVLEKWMVKTHDPLVEIYQKRNAPQDMLSEFYKIYPEAKIWDQNKSNYSLK